MTDTFTPPAPLNTAVLFLVFNRPDTTAQVFQAIRKAKPPRLYVAADGPRPGCPGEAEQVIKVREIATAVDWPCEVKTLFRDKNHGCKYAVSGSITWFFEHEEQGIILEDDCLPSQSFFWFCEQMLAKYRHNDSIALISGDGRIANAANLTEGCVPLPYPLIWGWASWAHKWSNYDVEMKSWPDNKVHILKNHKKYNKDFWNDVFTRTFQNQIDTWDYQLAYMMQKNQSYCLMPPKNLIKNIGFNRHDATHTTGSGKGFVFDEQEIELPAQMSKSLLYKDLAKNYADQKIFVSKPFLLRAYRRFLRIIGIN